MRSGTTFLVDKLSGHPQLFKVGVELNDVWDQVGGVKIIGNCKWKDGSNASAYYTYQMTSYFNEFIKNGMSVKRHLMRWVNLNNKKVGRVFYDWENIIPVNKSPHLINKVLYVDALFPGAKFIFIIRDIYAYSASLKSHFLRDYEENSKVSIQPDSYADCWSRMEESEIPADLKNNPRFPQDFGTIPKMWIRLNKIGLESIQKLDKDQFIVINYEELISNQELTFKKLFRFLSLEESHNRFENLIANKKIGLINSTTSGNPLSKWKKQLTEKEKEIIQSVIIENEPDYQSVLNLANKLGV